MITYNQRQLRNLTFSSSKEWLLTDGDGGFAFSTISFMNTRRQHSLFTVSLATPLKRFTLLNKLEEEVVIDGKSYFLGTNHYSDAVFPEGYKLMSKFTFDYFPQAVYDLSGCHVSKTLLMPKGSSSIFIHYENQSKKIITLRLLPLISFRLKDSIRKSGEGFLIDELPDGIRIISDMNLPMLYLKLSRIYNTSPESQWYYKFIYPHDSPLHKDESEDLFNMGLWEMELEPGKEATFVASTRDLGEFNYRDIESSFIEAADKVRSTSRFAKKYSCLADSVSNHLVRNDAIRTPTVISGYPYGGIDISDALLTLDGASLVSVSQNFDKEFLYELATNEMNGYLPSTIDEGTLQVNYGDPKISLYFAFALARRAGKEKNVEWIHRYLPLLESAIELITSKLSSKSDMKCPAMLDVGEINTTGSSREVENAFLNALWYNLLTFVDERKAEAGSAAMHSEATAEIISSYYESFFDADGSYKNSGGIDEIDYKMALPLVIPFSPLSEDQKSKICHKLVSNFLDSYGNEDAHRSPLHSCNLTAIYLLEASSQLKDCENELATMMVYVEKLFAMKEFTDCVNGLPKCGNTGVQPNQDISSSVVTAEAIRLIKKLKLK